MKTHQAHNSWSRLRLITIKVILCGNSNFRILFDVKVRVPIQWFSVDIQPLWGNKFWLYWSLVHGIVPHGLWTCYVLSNKLRWHSRSQCYADFSFSVSPGNLVLALQNFKQLTKFSFSSFCCLLMRFLNVEYCHASMFKTVGTMSVCMTCRCD
jgi:hypothetical protein